MATRGQGNVTVRLVNIAPQALQTILNLTGCHPAPQVRALTLQGFGSNPLQSQNLPGQPRRVWPRESTVKAQGGTLTISLPGYSFTTIDAQCAVTGGGDLPASEIEALRGVSTCSPVPHP